jgi:starch synthase
LRYGTVPIVRPVGGLADTVVDASPATLAAGTATGLVFDTATPAELIGTLRRALALYADRRRWKQLALTGMRQDFSWRHSAGDYRELYERLVRSRRAS